MQLSQVRLLVDDFAACYRFYRDMLHLEVGFGEEQDVYADFKLGDGRTLALFKRQLMADAIGAGELPVTRGQDSVLLSFEVPDLAATQTALQARGATFVAEPTDHPEWGMRTAHLRDPNGTLIELFVAIPMRDA